MFFLLPKFWNQYSISKNDKFCSERQTPGMCRTCYCKLGRPEAKVTVPGISYSQQNLLKLSGHCLAFSGEASGIVWVFIFLPIFHSNRYKVLYYRYIARIRRRVYYLQSTQNNMKTIVHYAKKSRHTTSARRGWITGRLLVGNRLKAVNDRLITG